MLTAVAFHTLSGRSAVVAAWGNGWVDHFQLLSYRDTRQDADTRRRVFVSKKQHRGAFCNPKRNLQVAN